MAKLRRLTLNGFKSIKRMDLELRRLNVLIGANGAGKSNFVSFFKMLNEMMAGRLQQHIGAAGRARSLLHFGPKVSPEMEARLEFEVDDGLETHDMRLSHAAGDMLIFAEEKLSFLQNGSSTPKSVSLGSGHEETRIVQKADEGEPTAKVFRRLLDHCRVHHFHDTSPMARVRQHSYIGDNRRLLPDAGNLAAFLLRLREESGGSVYRRIVTTIRLIAPFFDDFELEPASPDKKDIILNWREMHPPVLIAHAKKKGRVHRGGGRKYTPMKNDIKRFLTQESTATTKNKLPRSRLSRMDTTRPR